MYQNIIYESKNGIATITLNRPEVYNALNPVMIAEITQAMQEAENDATIRVVILTGSGEKAFCSGADLKDALSSPKSACEILQEFYDPMIRSIRNIPKPVVAKLNGLAVGAGCSLALACDIIIAREDAYLSLLFVQIGLMPDAGATFSLPRRVGIAKAFELSSTGRKVYAPEAEQIGLINKSVPAEELDREIEQLSNYYRSAPTLAIAAMKKVLNESYQSNLSQIQDFERENQEMLFKTRDAQEGISAFLQKRKPDFQGE
ncbi:enoyl-CoA hydratase/isomerase family protein [Dyadobacter luticola]|uniref:Enoyl-CoA hydratase n=1 Tax=Dyadobacter luticola TaxID=1979387 RepID=A0A5R9KVX3_9BACT|nr:enoyl-CoA hydratase [Dyadobacter luticola]TLV00318.1 enoyl-CoA hydratase [Dyadobacter luticola]